MIKPVYPKRATIRTYKDDGSIHQEWSEVLTHETLFFYVSAVRNNKGRQIRYRKVDGSRPDGGNGRLILVSITPKDC